MRCTGLNTRTLLPKRWRVKSQFKDDDLGLRTSSSKPIRGTQRGTHRRVRDGSPSKKKNDANTAERLKDGLLP